MIPANPFPRMHSPECFAERMCSSCPGGVGCQPPARAEGPHQLCRHLWASLASGDGCSPDCCRHQVQVNISTMGRPPFRGKKREREAKGKIFPSGCILPFLQYWFPFRSYKGEPSCHEDAGSLYYTGELLAMRLQFPFLTAKILCQCPSEENVKAIHNHLLWAFALW